MHSNTDSSFIAMEDNLFLSIALATGNLLAIEIILKLIPQLIDYERPASYTPLQFAIFTKHEEMLKLLLEYSKLESLKYQIALHFASIYGDLTSVKILIKHGFDINSVDSKGNTALHFAAKFGKLDVAQYLIEQNAKLHILNHEGWTPLLFAVYNQNFCMSELLVDYLCAQKAPITDDHYLVLLLLKNNKEIKLINSFIVYYQKLLAHTDKPHSNNANLVPIKEPALIKLFLADYNAILSNIENTNKKHGLLGPTLGDNTKNTPESCPASATLTPGDSSHTEYSIPTP